MKLSRKEKHMAIMVEVRKLRSKRAAQAYEDDLARGSETLIDLEYKEYVDPDYVIGEF